MLELLFGQGSGLTPAEKKKIIIDKEKAEEADVEQEAWDDFESELKSAFSKKDPDAFATAVIGVLKSFLVDDEDDIKEEDL